MKTYPIRIRVAIVEDNRPFRDSLVTVLSGSSRVRCVATCADGEQALREIPASKAEVVLVDLQLPKMSGTECIRQLKAQHPEQQFLVLTNFEDSDKIFGAIRAGASGYVTKREQYARMLEAIEEVRAGGAPMTPHIARRVLESLRESPSEQEDCEILTRREEEILGLAKQGLRYREIAIALDVSCGTVRTHFNHIYQKLHVHSRAEALMRFERSSALKRRLPSPR